MLVGNLLPAGASPAGGGGGKGGMAYPIFVFAPPPDLFLAPHGIFLGGKSCCFWPEKPLKVVISARKSFRITAKTFSFFFFFGDQLFLAGKNV